MDPEELARQADDDLNSVLVEPEAPDIDNEEDDDDDDSAPPQPETVEARPSRKERRRERSRGYNELKETTARLETALQQEREARARMEGLMQANLRPPQQQGPHPVQLEVEDALREQDEFYQYFTANLPRMTEAQKEEAGRRARALEIKKGTAMAKLANVQMGIARGPDPNQIRQLAFQEQLNMRYPDIASDPKAADLGGHIARALIAERGAATWEILDEAAEETRRRLGMKSTRAAPKPTEATKAKFVGAPKGPSGGSSGESKPIRITKKQAQMAENAYPTLAPGKAHQKWWNEVGKKYA